MNLYFDTEFSGLHKNTTLISIGIVTENGHKFYAEFVDYDKSQCDNWIKENVINNLKFETPSIGEDRAYIASRSDDNPVPNDLFKGYNIELQGTKEQIKNDLTEWLSRFDDIQFISDVCHYDFVLLIDLFGSAWDLPKNVNPACHDINQDIAKYYGISEKDAFDKSREEIAQELCSKTIQGDKHNALHDAEVIKIIYEKIITEGSN